jgi:phosphomevalonate kinase
MPRPFSAGLVLASSTLPSRGRFMRFSIPGAILLLGEYAILEKGGLGLAMAVERRARVQVDPWPRLEIHSVWPGRDITWTAEEEARAGVPAAPLLSAAVQEVGRWLRDAQSGRRLGNARISADSSELFRPDGRKAGLGSSAALTVGLVCALLSAAGVDRPLLQKVAAGIAQKAHRAAQGGVGSGYDVYCSFHGGLGLFRGGRVPTWTPVRLSWEPAVFLFPGRDPVRTPDAIQAYTKWKQTSPAAARSFLEQSNEAVRGFVKAVTEGEALRWLDVCRKLGVELGDAIGVAARVDAPAGLDPARCKAMGAGDELGACLLPRADSSPALPAWRAPLSPEGVAWEH